MYLQGNLYSYYKINSILPKISGLFIVNIKWKYLSLRQNSPMADRTVRTDIRGEENFVLCQLRIEVTCCISAAHLNIFIFIIGKFLFQNMLI